MENFWHGIFQKPNLVWMLVRVFHYLFVEAKEKGLTFDCFLSKDGNQASIWHYIEWQECIACFLLFFVLWLCNRWVGFFFFCIDAKPWGWRWNYEDNNVQEINVGGLLMLVKMNLKWLVMASRGRKEIEFMRKAIKFF